jgi:hypothetical protein
MTPATSADSGRRREFQRRKGGLSREAIDVHDHEAIGDDRPDVRVEPHRPPPADLVGVGGRIA